MIILDIDNCIADDEWRIPRINYSIPSSDPLRRYHDYHSLSGFDRVANMELYAGEHHTVIFTGRPVLYRALTEEWLRRAGVRYLHLLMRNVDDRRPSVQVKRTQVEWLRDNYDVPLSKIVAAYDDHLPICEMYQREFSIPSRNVRVHGTCVYTHPSSIESEMER